MCVMFLIVVWMTLRWWKDWRQCIRGLGKGRLEKVLFTVAAGKYASLGEKMNKQKNSKTIIIN